MFHAGKHALKEFVGLGHRGRERATGDVISAPIDIADQTARAGIAPVQPYSCPEMWLYCQDYSRPCSLSS